MPQVSAYVLQESCTNIEAGLKACLQPSITLDFCFALAPVVVATSPRSSWCFKHEALLNRSTPPSQTLELHVQLNLTGRHSAVGLLAAEGTSGFGFLGCVYGSFGIDVAVCVRRLAGLWFLNTSKHNPSQRPPLGRSTSSNLCPSFAC